MYQLPFFDGGLLEDLDVPLYQPMYQVLLGEAGETDLVVVQMVCASIYTLVKHVKNHRAQRTLMTVARFRNRPGSWVASQSARLARLLLLLDLG